VRLLNARAALAAATLTIAAGIASAQAPSSVSPADPRGASQQQQRQMTQPLNNQPVWSEVRSGEPQYTSIPGRETNVLIQSQGQTWRAARVPVATIGGFIFLAAILGLAGFYAWRGAMTAHEKPNERWIERFSPMDRYAHWLLAICWVTLAVTGLILSFGKSVLLPLIGYTLFSWLAILAKNLHNFVGPILIVAVPWVFVQYVRDNGIGWDDVRWFLNLKGYFTDNEYPSRRFNAGEKLVFWVVLVILSTALIATGLVLVFPNFDQTRATMQTANLIHMIAAYCAIGLACVHIYLGTIGMTGAYRAMRYGYVTESWAEHHHKWWYDAVVAGKSRQRFADPAEVDAAMREAPPSRTRTA